MKKLLSSIAIVALVASPAFAMGDSQKRVERMTQELNLNETQQQQIQAIMEQQRAELEALREQSKSKIAAVLTPEQQAKFDELREERKAKYGKKGRCGGEGKADRDGGAAE